MVNDSGDHKFFQNKTSIETLNGLISQTLDLKQDLNITIREIQKLLENYKKKELLAKRNQKILNNKIFKNKKSTSKQSIGNTNIPKNYQKNPKIKSLKINTIKSKDNNVINNNLHKLENADFTKVELPEMDNGVIGMLQLDINQKLLESVEKIDKKLNSLNTRFNKKITIVKKIKLKNRKKPSPVVKSKSDKENSKIKEKPVDENVHETSLQNELNEINEKYKNNNCSIDCLNNDNNNNDNHNNNNDNNNINNKSNNNNNSSNSNKSIKGPFKPNHVKIYNNKGNNKTEIEKKLPPSIVIKPPPSIKFNAEFIKQMEAEKELIEMEAEAEKRILFAISYVDNRKKAFKLNIIDKVNGNVLDHLNLTKEELSKLNSAKIFKKYSSVYMLQKPIDFDHFSMKLKD